MSRMKCLAVITRHGARSPGINIRTAGPTELLHQEEERWKSLVPSPADIQSKGYSQRFPVYASDEPLDAKHHTWPWGQLTKRGFQQTAAVGSLLRDRFGKLYDKALDVNSVNVLSSNFIRTQLSAQSLLSSLHASSSSVAIPVRTRSQAQCSIAMFQNDSGLRELTEAVFGGSVSLHTAEATRLTLRRSLHPHIPHLQQYDNVLTPPEYMWSHIVDFFACSDAHGWSEHDWTVSTPDELAQLGKSTMGHVVWRFSSLFRIPGALAKGLRGLLTDLLQLFRAHVQFDAKPLLDLSGSDSGTIHFALYSGHDVTVFPMLLFLHSCSGLPPPSSWPGYAAFVALELHNGSNSESFIRWRFWDPFPFPQANGFSGNDIVASDQLLSNALRDMDPPHYDIPIHLFVSNIVNLLSPSNPAS